MREDLAAFPRRRDSEEPPFHIELTGISYCDGTYRISRKGQKHFFVFEYVISGSGTIAADGRSVTAKAGDIYIIDGRKPHTYYSSSDDPWTKVWFNVNGTLVESMLCLYEVPSGGVFCGCEGMEKLFTRGCASLMKNPEKAQPEGAKILLEIIMRLGEKLKSREHGRTSNPDALKVKELIDRSHTVIPSLEKMSRAAGKSPAQTIRIFKKQYGLSPHAYASARRMESARLMLVNTNKSIKEIAAELCFTDEFYFSGEFKRYWKKSPSHYRKQHPSSI